MGIPVASANPFVKEVPTRREPNSPGPLVNAIASISLSETSAIFSALSTTGKIFC